MCRSYADEVLRGITGKTTGGSESFTAVSGSITGTSATAAASVPPHQTPRNDTIRSFLGSQSLSRKQR